MAPTPEAKPKRIRRRDVKRALVVTLYAFVTIITILSMASPAFM
jgi:hypothetical protein